MVKVYLVYAPNLEIDNQEPNRNIFLKLKTCYNFMGSRPQNPNIPTYI